MTLFILFMEGILVILPTLCAIAEEPLKYEIVHI